MKKGKFNLLLFLCIMITFILNNIFIFADTKFNADDEINGYEDGLQWGEITGYIYGQKDQLNGKKSNWENVYKVEKAKVVEDYNLDKKSYNYKNKFLDGFKEGFQLGYEIVYERPINYIKETTEELGTKHGEFFGGLLGAKYARNDAYNNKKGDWNRDMPVDSTIINQYNLRYDSKGYSDTFLKAYKKAYEEEYQLTYSMSSYDKERVSKEDAIDHGIVQGETAGLAQAMVDFIQGKSNDWQRALYEFEGEKDLIIRYALSRENSQYRLGFINGFREGFMKGYNKYYQQFNMEVAERNINYKRISMLEDIIEFEDEIINIINGVGKVEKRITAKLHVPPGAIYGETYISLQKQEVPMALQSTKYIPVTKIYDINIANDMKKVKLQKNLTLGFEYFGSSRGGIYELINNEWRYIYSDIKDGEIITEIPSREYSGGSYTVMIDENYVELRDISTHWARKELYTFLRRGYIKGDQEQKYKPDDKLTRGELLMLLSKVQNWNLSNTKSDINKFKDSDSFGSYMDVINHAVKEGYIKGYSDNTFRSNYPITYNEIESIIKKVTGNSEFKWDIIAESMMYEKYTRSQSRFSKNNTITKGEVIYMLHELQALKRI